MRRGEKIAIISTSVLVMGVLTFLFIYNYRKKNRRVIHNIIDKLPKSTNCTSSNRDLDEVDTIVVHQTDSKCKGDQHPFDTANHHINGNGWCGIGYHMFITEAGKIFQTRSLTAESPHAGSRNNRTSIGVVICGDHRLKDAQQNESIIPTEQYRSLVWTLAYLQKTYPRLTRIVSHDSLSASRTDPNLHMSELLRDVKKTRV
jgi:N-acetyl-anhydromuramyl-L-alanine amidase AmpD